MLLLLSQGTGFFILSVMVKLAILLTLGIFWGQWVHSAWLVQGRAQSVFFVWESFCFSCVMSSLFTRGRVGLCRVGTAQWCVVCGVLCIQKTQTKKKYQRIVNEQNLNVNTGNMHLYKQTSCKYDITTVFKFYLYIFSKII